jgi:hypothetical protein
VSLRSRLTMTSHRIFPSWRPDNPPMICHVLALGDVVVGSIIVTAHEPASGDAAGHIRWSEIDARYRGLGLGRKLYAEAARRHQYIYSCRGASPSARRVWDSMLARPPGSDAKVTQLSNVAVLSLHPRARVELRIGLPLAGAPRCGDTIAASRERGAAIVAAETAWAEAQAQARARAQVAA